MRKIWYLCTSNNKGDQQAHQQLLSGFFGLGSKNQVSHYLEGVRSSRKNEQDLIRRAVHWIQTLLVHSLANGPLEVDVTEGLFCHYLY